MAPYPPTDGVRDWFIRQGYAWLVDFGQDTPDFNPDSIVRIARGANGVWAWMP